MEQLKLEDIKLGLIGLGYVGLPLAVSFAKKRDVVGFDANPERINELCQGFDRTNEFEPQDFEGSLKVKFTNNPADLKDCNFYIVTVPTPVDSANNPDLSALISASRIVGELLSPSDIIVYESTVFPGATEEVCVPVLEHFSDLSCALDDNRNDKDCFYVGYSPERINPGDKIHKISDIVKVTSGSTPRTAKLIDDLYRSIITAGTFLAESIRVAEAAKVIENIQRDVNIALVNEFALIFDKIGIATHSVLEAAETKWNFLPFRPGLVGGHCIGVDPYYLTYRAAILGYSPEVILAGRRINEHMSQHVAERVVKLMLKKRIELVDSCVLILGLTFKPNCPDVRNSKVLDLIDHLVDYGCVVDAHDPKVSSNELVTNFQGNFVETPSARRYDAIILAVAHDEFRDLGIEQIRCLGKENHVLFDVMNIFENHLVDGSL